MSSNEQLKSILYRLSSHFIPEEDNRYWQALSFPTEKERKIIESIKSFGQKQIVELTPEVKENDWQLLGYLVKRFSDAFLKEPFDEQILALVRAIEAFKDPQKRGLILQIATGEGKSSVIIPILTAFLYFKGERVEIYEINPYLLNESHQRFLEFAKQLGIKEEVGFLKDFQDKEQAREKPIVFGYWSNFIHHHQLQFLTDRKESQKPPIMILDEVDPLLNEEATVPAVIAEEKEEETILIINSLIEQTTHLLEKEEVDEEEQKRQQEIKGKLKQFKLRGKEVDLLEVTEEKPDSPEEFFERIKTIFNHLARMMKEDETFKKMSEKQKRNKLFATYMWRLFINIFEIKSGISFEILSEEEKRALGEIFPDWMSLIWFSFFEQEIVSSFLMEEGKDYVIEKKDNKIEIIPLAPQTGYQERNKRFNFLTYLFLLIKHAENLDQLPKTISIRERDKMSILAYYVNAVESGVKVFGFTGTATIVAKRLREVYSLETTVLPTHFKTKRQENPMEFFETQEGKIKRTVEILQSQPSRNTLIVVERPEEAEMIKEALEENFGERVIIRFLSAKNEKDDAILYQWLSKKEGKRKILVCVKMVGRGVDLKPDKQVIEEGGFLLISLTPFKYERSYQQLLGRVGRRGEKGEVYTLVSLDDEIFSYLSEEEKAKLIQFLKKERFDKIQKAVERAWRYWEDEITQRMRYWIIFSEPIERIRLWIEGKIKLPFYEEKEILSHNLNPEEFRRYLHTCWADILQELEDTYQAWLAAGSLTPFGQTNNPKSFWTNYVFSYLRDRFMGEFF